MSVILRYGAAQKQRLGLARRAERSSADGVSPSSDAMETIEEVDPVAAMVEGVKTRGVRLLHAFSLLKLLEIDITCPPTREEIC